MMATLRLVKSALSHSCEHLQSTASGALLPSPNHTSARCYLQPLIENSDLYVIVRSELAREFDLEPGKITREASLEGLGIDSLGLVELLFRLEDTMKLNLPEDRGRLESVGDLVREMERAVAQGSPIGNHS